MKKVFVAIEENSPELRSGNGAYELIGVYETWEKALEDAKIWVEDNEGYNYLEVGEAEINEAKQRYYNIVYCEGDKASDLWTELRIKPVPVQ